ncbi:sulfotransferase [Verrucomicrobia bacterium]|nr:sulfotransferase [Verrucomicrobiota bacterium]
MKRVFGNHPQCAVVPEYRFPIDPDGLVDFMCWNDAAWSPYAFDVRLKRLERLLNDIGRNVFIRRVAANLLRETGLERLFPVHVLPAYSLIGFRRCSPSFHELTRNLIQELREFRYDGQWTGMRFGERRRLSYASKEHLLNLTRILGGYWQAVIAEVCGVQDAAYFLDDNTWNILFFDKILKLVPYAKIVHVIRDPRDVVASYRTMRWAPTKVSEAALWYKGIMQRWLAVKAQCPEDSYMEVRLHEVVEHPDFQLRCIAKFWGVPWDESLKKESLGKSHTGRWKRDFDEKERFELDSLLRDEIELLGYT